MKICFLSSLHTPTDKRVFYKEARSLAGAGFEVVHLAPGQDEPTEVDGVRLETFPPPHGLVERVLGMPRLLRRARRIKADVYHANEVDSWVVALLLKAITGKTVVFDVHEHYPTIFGINRFPSWAQPPISCLVRMLLRSLTPFTDYLVFAKASVAADFPGSGDKSEFVFNYAPLTIEDLSRDQVPAEVRALYQGRFSAIHVGGLSRERGWPQLLAATQRCCVPDLQLVFIGEIIDGSEPDFWRTAEQYGLKERVVFLPWMPYAELCQHLLCAQVGLVLFQPGDLNNVYAMPHKMFDYMAAGKAVVIPDFAVEVAPIVAKHHAGLLVDPSRKEGIAAALQALSDDREQCRAMGARGREAVLAEYNWEREARKLVAVYHRLAGGA